MNIGLAIAVAREFKAFLESEYETEILHHKNYEIYHTKINNNDIYACKTGCGKIDAAAATQMLISVYDCEVILNYGVTGAVDKLIQAKDLFVVTDAVNHNFDTSSIDPVKKHQYSDLDDIYIPLDKDLVALALQIYPELKPIKDATGDNFVDQREQKEYLFSLGCGICDMEIAAIARTCYLNGVKCFSVKCISDCYDGDGRDFQKNILEASKKAFDLMSKMLKAL